MIRQNRYLKLGIKKRQTKKVILPGQTMGSILLLNIYREDTCFLSTCSMVISLIIVGNYSYCRQLQLKRAAKELNLWREGQPQRFLLPRVYIYTESADRTVSLLLELISAAHSEIQDGIEMMTRKWEPT